MIPDESLIVPWEVPAGGRNQIEGGFTEKFVNLTNPLYAPTQLLLPVPGIIPGPLPVKIESENVRRQIANIRVPPQ